MFGVHVGLKSQLGKATICGMMTDASKQGPPQAEPPAPLAGRTLTSTSPATC